LRVAELQSQAQSAPALLQRFDQILAGDQAFTCLLGAIVALVEANAI
jgi:hypothetical protein